MTVNVRNEVALLRRMTVGQLRDRYADVHGEPTRSYHKEFLVRRIAWRLQANEEGDLTERARRRADEIANDADLRLRPPPPLRLACCEAAEHVTARLTLQGDSRLPIPGTLLTRDYKGQRLVVRVLDRGFEYEGARYRSLSAIARAITGSNWNGHLFFGLRPYASQKRGGA